MLWTSFFAIIAGFALLVWGADRFVIGASATARNLGVSPLIIGLTIVGFGTSAPEILVSAMAAWAGNPDMGIGNALGSNITNVGLVLGVTALVTPLSVHSDTLKREFPLLFAVMLIALALLLDGEMNRYDGILLLIGMASLIYWMVALGLRERRNADPMVNEYSDEIPDNMPMKLAILWLIVGMAILLGSSRLLVWGSVNVAQWLGVSDLIIGLTIVAIGTSLPELAASVMSALKGEHDIAVGNVLGSNMFNLLAVLGMPGLIHPGVTPTELMSRDFPVMIGLTILLFIMSYGFLKPGRISRGEGALLLLCYLGYLGLLYHSLNG
ncbi:MAG: calcium/sodium antiporter [Pseudomonadota bacterium]